MKRQTAYVSGKVQKTGYRANVVILANAFGLQGYVQNLPNGKVKVVAEGEQIDLERFRSCLSIKDALIDVQSIEYEYTAATGDFIGFEKMVSGGETDQRLDKADDLLDVLGGLGHLVDLVHPQTAQVGQPAPRNQSNRPSLRKRSGPRAAPASPRPSARRCRGRLRC